MGLGKIFGSISPAYGLISGKGLFGDLGHALGSNGGLGGLASMGGLGMLLNLLGGHHGDDSPAPAPTPAPGSAPVDIVSSPVVSPPNAIMAPGNVPPMGQPSALNSIGSALMNGPRTDPSAGLGFSQAPPIQRGGLQAMLQSLGIL